MTQRQVLQELLGRNPRPFFEHPLKMKRAQMYMPGNLLQRRLVLEMGLIKVDSFRYPFVIDCNLCFHDLAFFYHKTTIPGPPLKPASCALTSCKDTSS